MLQITSYKCKIHIERTPYCCLCIDFYTTKKPQHTIILLLLIRHNAWQYDIVKYTLFIRVVYFISKI